MADHRRACRNVPDPPLHPPAPSRPGRALAALLTLAGCLPPAGARQADSAAADWSPQLVPALQAYRAGDYLAARRLCQALIPTTTDVGLRREAAALGAMALMRMPARSDRLDGRARLAGLAREDPRLGERPECRLALGIAAAELDETGAAIRQLKAAARGFEARRQYDRLAEAYAALAGAWARHNEWQVPLGEGAPPPPHNAAEARAIRRARLLELRQKVAALPAAQGALARIGLLLARDYIETGDKVGQGVEILARLSRQTPLTAPAAEACLSLAARFEKQRRWPEALRLYQRVEAARLGERSERAARRAAAITRPQLVVQAPPTVPVGQPVRVALRARNVDRVRFELRRVDLAGWLRSRRGRFAEAGLPASGAVAAARELETRSAAAHDWWSSGSHGRTLRADLGPGAYVALAEAITGAGDAPVAKRLILVSDLHAVVVVGRRHALLWASPRGGAEPPPAAPLSARFWIHGSFVPKEVSAPGGLGRFELPAEAWRLRDKRWVCLVQSGAHLALCRGALPLRAYRPHAGPAVALLADAPRPRWGQAVNLFGLLLPRQRGSAPWQAGQRLQLELVDTRGARRGAAAARVSASGTFRARLPIAAELAGARLSLVVRSGGRVLENLRGRFKLNVAPADEPRFVARCRLPARFDPAAAELTGQLSAAYPWGTPLAGARVYYLLRAAVLPAPQQPAARPVPGLPLSGAGRLDEQGRLAFRVPLSAFGLLGSPLAVGIWAHVIGWDGRQADATARTLVGANPLHLWLDHEPAAPKVGQPVRFRLAWFDPGRLASGGAPAIEVRRGAELAARPKLHPADHAWQSAAWRPERAGSYEVSAALPLSRGAAAGLRQSLRVEPGGPLDGAIAAVRCAARYVRRDGSWGLRVRLRGTVALPLLVMAEAGDPLAAGTLRGLAGAAELFLPIPGQRPPDARVLVAALAGSALRLVTGCPVQPAHAEAPALRLEPAPGPVAPGGVVRVDVACRPGGDSSAPATMLLARLSDADDSGHVTWMPGPPGAARSAGRDDLSIATSGGLAPPADAALAGGSPAPLRPALWAALLAGPTLWAELRPVQARITPLEVPVPPRPGRYRLHVLARTAAGWTATDSLLLAARAGLRYTADLPQAFSVGDRGILALTLENPQPRTVQTRVRIAVGDGLEIETVRALTAGGAQRTLDWQARRPLRLPPGGQARLLARVEAVRSGQATARIELESGAVRQRAELHYRVWPLEAARPGRDARPPRTIRLKRTLLWLIDEAEQFAPPAQDHTPQGQAVKDWIATPLSPGERVAPGTRLLLQDEFELDTPLEEVVWSQRLPGACVAPAAVADEFRALGPRRSVRSDLVSYSAARLSAGKQVHECPLLVVRPGSYRLPPPDIRVRGQRLAVEVQPDDLPVVVPLPARSDHPPQP